MIPYVMIPSQGSDMADERCRLGIEMQMAGKVQDAERNYAEALRLNPRHAVTTCNYAVLLATNNRLNEGLLAAERAAMFDGVQPLIHTNRALMCLAADRIDEALDAARHAVKLASSKPHSGTSDLDRSAYVAARLALALCCGTAGLGPEAVPLYNDILEVEPKHGMAAANACFLQTLCATKTSDMLDQRKKWRTATLATMPEGFKPRPHRNDSDPDRKLRIGYVGGDFKRHSASQIFANVVLKHTDAFEVYLYSSLPSDPAVDPMAKRFRDAVGDRFRDCTKKDDEELDLAIRADKIDVLVDLAAHTAGNRLSVFLRRPAPVQVSAWGFAHGTGLPEIDAFLADSVAVPETVRKDYAEKIVDLPCIVTYFEPTEYASLKGSSPAPCWNNDFVTFGSYARYEKFSDDFLAACASVVAGVPGSRIEFKDSAFKRPYSIRRVMRFMDAAKVAPERVLFSLGTDQESHMRTYQQADLCLDPFPHGGGVVSLEQLYMGVPLLALAGPHTGGRNTASILTAIGRQDWVAGSVEEYVEKAVALAEQASTTLAKARKTLRQELLGSPVVKDYHLAAEAAYRGLWRAWCER